MNALAYVLAAYAAAGSAEPIQAPPQGPKFTQSPAKAKAARRSRNKMTRTSRKQNRG